MSKYVLPAGCAVLLTGATGFTGSHLTQTLIKQGVKVRAMVRSGSAARELESLGVGCVVGALDDRSAVDEAMKGVEVVFNLASPYRSAEAPIDMHRAVHVEGARNLAEAAMAQPGFRRFVHVSTVGVHGHIEQPPGNEDTPFAPDDDYQNTKLEGEEWIRGFAASSGLPLVVVRPAAIYGPGDDRLMKLFKMATHPVVPIIGYGRGLYHLVHVDDLVNFLVLSALHPAAVGEAFICAGREPISIEEIIRTAGQAYGIQNRFVRIPTAPVMALARLCEAVCRPFGIRPPLYPRRVAFFTKDRAFDASKMTRLLGFEPERENDEGIREAARWYAKQGLIKVSGGTKG
jgi:nucleoside-diphosphate-sugar epimerase